MALIGASLSGIERALLSRIAEANTAATLNAYRMTTGQKINAPSDNPSAFTTLSLLQSRLTNVTATLSNVTAAGSMIGQAQSTLDEIRTQLNTIRTELLTDEDHDLRETERAEAQASIDEAIDQINSLASTQIDGRHLLDGSADFVVSGRNSSQVVDVTVHSTGSFNPVQQIISGSVTTAATQAQLLYTGSGGKTTAAATFTLTGDLGSAAIVVTDEEALSSVATKINNQSHNTGVTASVDGDALTLSSVGYGTGTEMSVVVSIGTFNVTGGNGDGTANGTAAIAEINGHTRTGDSTDNGNRFTINQNGFHYEIEFAPGFTGTFEPITVSGNALTFALSPELTHRSTLSIPSLQASQLGGLSGRLDQIYSGGSVSGLDENTSHAIRIVDEALAELTVIEGSVDGFYNASITSASNLLDDLQEDLEDAIDETDGYDENEEILLLAKNQELVSNGLAGLAVLNQQRASIVALIQQIAGLT